MIHEWIAITQPPSSKKFFGIWSIAVTLETSKFLIGFSTNPTRKPFCLNFLLPFSTCLYYLSIASIPDFYVPHLTFPLCLRRILEKHLYHTIKRMHTIFFWRNFNSFPLMKGSSKRSLVLLFFSLNWLLSVYIPDCWYLL